MAVLAESTVASRIPARDLRRAKSFYAEKLGLEPIEERPGGLRYLCGNGEFALFESAGTGDHTQMAWEVDDLEETIAALRERRVIFEEYDLPGLQTVNGIAEVEGNYPSKGGVGEKAAWSRTARATCSPSAKPSPEDPGAPGPRLHRIRDIAVARRRSPQTASVSALCMDARYGRLDSRRPTSIARWSPPAMRKPARRLPV